MTTILRNDAQELADALRPFAPGGWIISVSDDHRSTVKVLLPVANILEIGTTIGAGLTLHLDDYLRHGRVVVRGVYPQGTWGQDRDPGITVSRQRGPEALVKDIIRRMLPSYLPSYARAAARQRADDAYRADKAANLTELAAIVGTTPNGESAYFYRRRLNVNITDTSRGTADLKMTVPQALARQILELIAAAAGDHPE